MKKLELERFGVMEMDAEDMVAVEGGSWIGRAVAAVTQVRSRFI